MTSAVFKFLRFYRIADTLICTHQFTSATHPLKGT